MGSANIAENFRCGMGSQLLPFEQGRRLHLWRVCRLCETGVWANARHMLPECPTFADFRKEVSVLIADCTGVMAALVWAHCQQV